MAELALNFSGRTTVAIVEKCLAVLVLLAETGYSGFGRMQTVQELSGTNHNSSVDFVAWVQEP